ncbi:hypothetical protein [Photobacterium kishitanii]|uniref:Uncharacterized protein n=1 Tax=Photobacterium kishitanii TaxID=318456 RepID=A0A2T3KLT2_9GAMM|nr:hypothetical protein [Photobacterium kishitanii]PSV00633.1 hypothetical protein C9J27_05710 [Photobacterium kishitanii]
MQIEQLQKLDKKQLINIIISSEEKVKNIIQLLSHLETESHDENEHQKEGLSSLSAKNNYKLPHRLDHRIIGECSEMLQKMDQKSSFSHTKKIVRLFEHMKKRVENPDSIINEKEAEFLKK